MRVHIDWSPAVDAADWLVHRLHGLGVDTGSLVPTGFSAYVRVLHPAWQESRQARVKVRWAQLARSAGDELATTTQYRQVKQGSAPGMRAPDQGTLAPDELAAAVEILAGHTARPDMCWFGVWDGYGWMTGPPAIATMGHAGGEYPPLSVTEPPPARVQLPGRTLALYRGDITDAGQLCREPLWQSPNLWWPDDHAWCVSSDIDLRSTYVAGSAALAEALAADDRLEVLRVSVDDPIAG